MTRHNKDASALYDATIPAVKCPKWLRASLEKQAQAQEKRIAVVIREHLIRACRELEDHG